MLDVATPSETAWSETRTGTGPGDDAESSWDDRIVTPGRSTTTAEFVAETPRRRAASGASRSASRHGTRRRRSAPIVSSVLRTTSVHDSGGVDLVDEVVVVDDGSIDQPQTSRGMRERRSFDSKADREARARR